MAEGFELESTKRISATRDEISNLKVVNLTKKIASPDEINQNISFYPAPRSTDRCDVGGRPELLPPGKS